MTPAEQVRQARVRAALTQSELARRSGVRQPNIAAYENGSRSPSPQMLAKLLAAARPRPSVLLAERRREVLHLARRHRVRNVRVFGSVARREDTADSDVDLLVTFADDASLYELADLVDELSALLEAHVDVVSDRALRPRDESIRREAVPL